MANIVNNATFYGKTWDEMMRQFFVSSITAGKGLVTPLLGVKGREHLPYLTQTLNIRERDCSFTAGGVVTMDEKIITTVVYTDQVEFCKPDLYKFFDQSGLFEVTPGIPGIAEQVLNYAVAQRLEKLKSNWDNIIWNSDTALGANPLTGINLQDGFTKLINAGSPIPAGLTPATVTVLNVVSMFESIVEVMPEVFQQAVQTGDRGLYIVTNYTINTLLWQALQAIPIAQWGAFERKDYISPNGSVFTNVWWVQGVPIIPIPNFRADTAFLVHHDILFLGTDIDSEDMYIKTLDMENTTLEPKIRFNMGWVFGMQIGNQSNLFVEFYKP